MTAPVHPTIELDAAYAYIRLHADGIFTPLRFEWANYPEAFARYMGFLQPPVYDVNGQPLAGVEVSSLRLLVEEQT